MSAIALQKERQRKYSDAYFEGKKTGVSPLKQTGEGLLRDITIGVIGGGLASAILGRYSFILGLGVAGYGHYAQNKTLSALGLGMMASGTFHALAGRDQDDKKSVGEKVTERVDAFKSEMKRKLWLDYFERNKKTNKKQMQSESRDQQEELNGTVLNHEEQIGQQTKSAPQEYFRKEKAVPVNVEDYPELNEKETAFLTQKVDQAINKEMKAFFDNRSAVASYLETGVIPAMKAETKADLNSDQDDEEENTESDFSESEWRTESKKRSSQSKPNPYPDDEPEPQELIF